jgi:hypothetical protein
MNKTVGIVHQHHVVPIQHRQQSRAFQFALPKVALAKPGFMETRAPRTKTNLLLAPPRLDEADRRGEFACWLSGVDL